MSVLRLSQTDVFVVQKGLFAIKNGIKQFFQAITPKIFSLKPRTDPFGKMSVLRLLKLMSFSLEWLVFFLERHKALSFSLFCLKRKSQEISNSPFGKVSIVQLFLLSRIGRFLSRTSPNTFSNPIQPKKRMKKFLNI